MKVSTPVSTNGSTPVSYQIDTVYVMLPQEKIFSGRNYFDNVDISLTITHSLVSLAEMFHFFLSLFPLKSS